MRRQAQPYRNGGGKPGPAKAAMQRGRAAGRPHPKAEQRKLEKRAKLMRRILRGY